MILHHSSEELLGVKLNTKLIKILHEKLHDSLISCASRGEVFKKIFRRGLRLTTTNSKSHVTKRDPGTKLNTGIDLKMDLLKYFEQDWIDI